jgi:hypothetical protein
MAKFSFAARTSNLMRFYDELLSGAPAGAGRG